MPHATKIATCCYCGTRAALVLRGRDRHELSCAACGAPLHDLKMLRTDAVAPGRPATARKTAKPRRDSRRKPPRKPRRRKSLGIRFLKEAFDVIEDIFD